MVSQLDRWRAAQQLMKQFNSNSKLSTFTYAHKISAKSAR